MHAAGEGGGTRPRASGAGALARRMGRRLAALRLPTRGALHAFLAEEAETEARARSGFFLVPIGLVIGIAIVDGAGIRLGLAPSVLLAVPGLALAWRLGGRGVAGVGMLLAGFAAAGMMLASAELQFTRTTIFSGEATVRIEGRVTWRDRDERNRMRYLVRIERTERPVLSRPPELAAILVSRRHEPIPVGGRFAALVRLRAPSGPAYPGAYDFAFAPFFEGRGANGFALGAPEPPQTDELAPTLAERLVGLRLAMSDRIRDVIGGGAGAVASALITGERSGIPEDIDHWLRATGLSHVLSISGLHMALVAGFAMVLVRGLLAALPGAALVLPAKKIAAVAALLVATGYLILSGSDVATDRSYVMLAIMLAAILVDRPALTLRNVAVAAIVVMVMTPHAVVTASFQMSFSATMALVGLYGTLSKRMASREDARTKRHPLAAAILFLAGLAASSAIAGSATAPYAAYHFQRIAPYGVIANLVAIPVFSFWIMPLALIAALAMPFALDAPFLVAIGWGLDLVFALAKLLATNLPDAPSGRLTQTGLVAITAALFLACLPAGRLRWAAVPVTILALIILPVRDLAPDLLVFEDGRDLATIDTDGWIHPMRPRPNGFVFDQWSRAFATRTDRPAQTGGEGTDGDDAESMSVPSQTSTGGSPPLARSSRRSGQTPQSLDAAEIRQPTEVSLDPKASSSPAAASTAFTCTNSPLPPETPRASTTGAPSHSKPAPPRRICRATTRSGLKIAWTDDHRLTGTVCDTADIAIVARAIALKACRSGARLITLRTLRQTGSLAVYPALPGEPARIEVSIADPDEPWNRHRRAPWPEAWRNPGRSKPLDPALSPAASTP